MYCIMLMRINATAVGIEIQSPFNLLTSLRLSRISMIIKEKLQHH